MELEKNIKNILYLKKKIKRNPGIKRAIRKRTKKSRKKEIRL